MYEIVSYIGKGSTGNVYKVKEKSSRKTYALKQTTSPKFNDIIQNEAEIFHIIKNSNDNVIKCYKEFETQDNNGNKLKNLLLEYCEYGSVSDIVTKSKLILTELEISSILYMLLKSIIYLHSKNLIHRDIKARNILVDSKGLIKLCDFGICRKLIPNKMFMAPRVGYPSWMALCVHKREEFDETSDIWSIGITAIEICNGYPPFCNLNQAEVMKLVGEKKNINYLEYMSNRSEKFKKFVIRCLQRDKSKRPSAKELIQDEFIRMGESYGRTEITWGMIRRMNLLQNINDNKNNPEKYRSSCISIDDGSTIYNQSSFMFCNSNYFKKKEEKENTTIIGLSEEDISGKNSIDERSTIRQSEAHIPLRNFDTNLFFPSEISYSNENKDQPKEEIINELYKKRDYEINLTILRYKNKIKKLELAKQFLLQYSSVKKLREIRPLLYSGLSRYSKKYIRIDRSDGSLSSLTTK